MNATLRSRNIRHRRTYRQLSSRALALGLVTGTHVTYWRSQVAA